MSDCRLLRQAGLFFSWEKWWKPILSFIYTKCSAFEADNPTHDEFLIFQSFMEIIMTDLIDNQFCRKSVFENVMFTLLQPSERRAQIIWDTIEQATDLLEFRSEMISCNVWTEILVSQALSEFTENHRDVSDCDEISVLLAQTAQEKINKKLSANFAEQSDLD